MHKACKIRKIRIPPSLAVKLFAGSTDQKSLNFDVLKTFSSGRFQVDYCEFSSSIGV